MAGWAEVGKIVRNKCNVVKSMVLFGLSLLANNIVKHPVKNQIDRKLTKSSECTIKCRRNNDFGT